MLGLLADARRAISIGAIGVAAGQPPTHGPHANPIAGNLVKLFAPRNGAAAVRDALL